MLFLFAPWPRLEWTRLLLQEPNQQLPCMFLTHSSEMHQPREWKWQGSPGGFVIAHQRLPQSATATTEQNDHLLCGSKVVMKCKMWCLDLEHNEVAQVYASQIKDRVVRFGMEHPGSQVPEWGLVGFLWTSRGKPKKDGFFTSRNSYWTRKLNEWLISAVLPEHLIPGKVRVWAPDPCFVTGYWAGGMARPFTSFSLDLPIYWMFGPGPTKFQSPAQWGPHPLPLIIHIRHFYM